MLFQLKLIFDVFQVEDKTDVLFPAFMQARHPCYWVLERDAVVLQSRVGFVSSDCVAAICGGRVPVPACPPWPSKYFQMQHRMPVARASAEAVGFKCSNCDGIFDSRIAVAFHRCHVSCQGTACADSSSIQSLSFTGRADMSTGILRHHPGPETVLRLGAFYDCCALSSWYCRCFPVEIKRVSSL